MLQFLSHRLDLQTLRDGWLFVVLPADHRCHMHGREQILVHSGSFGFGPICVFGSVLSSLQPATPSAVAHRNAVAVHHVMLSSRLIGHSYVMAIDQRPAKPGCEDQETATSADRISPVGTTYVPGIAGVDKHVEHGEHERDEVARHVEPSGWSLADDAAPEKIDQSGDRRQNPDDDADVISH